MEAADIEDHELMLAVRNGDLARLGDLFERHHRPLYGFFVKCTGQHAASEDLVQQVFYRILKYRHTYRDEGKFTTWMYHMARRVAADHYRKYGQNSNREVDPETVQEIPDPQPQADSQASTHDDIELLHKALAILPPDQREIITLQRFQKLSHEQLAALYECKVGAMKVRAHRALNSLREIFFRLQKQEGPAS